MNQADMDAVLTAMKPIVNIEAPLFNIKSRGPRAAKFWKSEIPNYKGKAKDQEILKLAATEMVKVLKLVDQSEKDIKKVLVLCQAKYLSRFPSKAEFRTKVAPFLKSIVLTEKTASKLKIGLSAKSGVESLFIGSKNIDVKATLQAFDALVIHSNALRIGLAKL